MYYLFNILQYVIFYKSLISKLIIILYFKRPRLFSLQYSSTDWIFKELNQWSKGRNHRPSRVNRISLDFVRSFSRFVPFRSRSSRKKCHEFSNVEPHELCVQFWSSSITMYFRYDVSYAFQERVELSHKFCRFR